MRYPERMDRPLSDDDRRWLKSNNLDDVADRFDQEDGVGDYAEDEPETEKQESPDYTKMTVSDLVAEIERRNAEILDDDEEAEPISTDGRKADLIQRLREDDEAVAASS